MGSLVITFYLAVLAALAISGVTQGPESLFVSAIVTALAVVAVFAIAEFVRKPQTHEP